MERLHALMRQLAISEQIRESGTESIAEANDQVATDAVPKRVNDLVERASGNLEQMAVCDDKRELTAEQIKRRQKALRLFRDHAGQTLLRAAMREAPEPQDRIVAEAIIIADGTRPSFLLCGGEVSPTDPFLGNWGGQVAASRAGITRLSAAVGRIQPAGGHASHYIGTGSLIAYDKDSETGLVLTNMHVIDDARTVFNVPMSGKNGYLSVDGGMEIDFCGEACSLDTAVFRITEVRCPASAGAVFAGVDAAVVKIERMDNDVRFPQPVPLLSSDPAYAQGAMTSLATIGFPAAPSFQDDAVDWNFVLGELFGNRFGVKRLAPGLFTQKLGSHAQDTGRRAIGHDATTFGGASGSLVVVWLDAQTPCFALHFGGQTGVSNYALSFAKERAELMAIGVPL